MVTTTSIAQRLLEENNFVTDASSVNVTAQNVLDEYNYTVADMPLTKMEPIMNGVINHVNLETNTSITLMSGTAESKIVTLTRSESVAVKTLSALMVRAYLDRGPNTAIQGQSIGHVISDPQYSFLAELAVKAMTRLKTANPVYVEQLIKNAIDLINLHAGTSIADLSGTSGSKSLSATNDETIVVKLIASLFLLRHMGGDIGNFELTETLLISIDKLRSTGGIAFVVGNDTSGLD